MALLLACQNTGGQEDAPPAPELSAGLAEVPLTPLLERELAADTLRFESGDNLDALLKRAAISEADRLGLLAAVVAVFDPGHFRAGHSLILFRDEEGQATGLSYAMDYLHDLAAWRVGDAFKAERFTTELDFAPRMLKAELAPSFYESFVGQGLDGDLATRTADLFAGEIDFFFDLRPGDLMELLVESAHRPDREESTTRILGARLSIGDTLHEAWLFPDEQGRRRYFHRDGSSLERQFLRAPLSFTRISSGFTSRRLHPILKVTRPHYGVDYAASTGTPVLATADGSVVQRSSSSGAGRFIKLRHPGRIVTTYMHLSRFASGTAIGQRVRKGQVIGYVGSSGLSTGPHLDYRIQVNGNYVNPRSFASPASEPLPDEERVAFDRELTRYDALWDSLLLDDEARRLSASKTGSEASE